MNLINGLHMFNFDIYSPSKYCIIYRSYIEKFVICE